MFVHKKHNHENEDPVPINSEWQYVGAWKVEKRIKSVAYGVSFEEIMCAAANRYEEIRR